jgi:hypothetical protein
MNDKSATKTPLFVKKDDSKKGSLWNDFANRRIIKQHGGFDIPEDDLHAIHKYADPIQTPTTTPEETNATLSDLEKEIKQLKEKENRVIPTSKPPEDFEEFLDDNQTKNYNDQDDELR